jgi:hypothetical protein
MDEFFGWLFRKYVLVLVLILLVVVGLRFLKGLFSPSAFGSGPRAPRYAARGVDPSANANGLKSITFQQPTVRADGDQLVITIVATEERADRAIQLPVDLRDPMGRCVCATVYDQAGNSFTPSEVSIANVTARAGTGSPLVKSRLLTGVPTAITLAFSSIPKIAGTLEIKTVTLLDVPLVIGDKSEFPFTNWQDFVHLRFRHLAVQ